MMTKMKKDILTQAIVDYENSKFSSGIKRITLLKRNNIGI